MTTDSRALDAAAPEYRMQDCRRCDQPMAMTKDPNYTGRRHRSRGLCTACCTSVTRAGQLDQYPRLQRRTDDVVARYNAYMAENPRARMREAAEALGMPRPTLSMALARHRANVAKDQQAVSA